jgi:hypothetical protein
MTALDLSNPGKLPLKDLPDDIASAMFMAERHGAKMEVFIHNKWEDVMQSFWFQNNTYRIAPSAAPGLTPDVIRWKRLPAWVIAVARDKDGGVWGHESKATKDFDCWDCDGEVINLSVWPKIVKRGTMPWDQSLQLRPVAVQS